MTCPYTISGIKDGQYRVTIDLQEWLCSEQILEFRKNIQDIGSEDHYFKDTCGMCGSILHYRSETLFPEKDDPNKQKILIILGNPATHSVAKEMFFYSMREGENGGEKRHKFWTKLEKAKLIEKIRCKTLEQEASKRKQLILGGQTSPDYLLGLTTFYSFPTPVKPHDNDAKKQKEITKIYPYKMKYGNAAGVEQLFQSALAELQKMEYERLKSYKFSQSADWIFTQQSSLHYVLRYGSIKYWPIRGAESGGDDLKVILQTP